MHWVLSHRADHHAVALADRHYSRQKPGTPQFVPPGRCLVLRTESADAVWVTSWPFAEYVRHAWAGAWICSIFRNEGSVLSSRLVESAVAATAWFWSNDSDFGMVTFIDTAKTRRKRDPGRCFRRAGFDQAFCPVHAWLDLILDDCAACQGRTEGGLIALQLLPVDLPDAAPPIGGQLALIA